MTDQDRLEELLNRWEDLLEAGKPAREEDICRDFPKLLPEFRRRTAKLKEIGSFLDGEIGKERDELTAAGRYRPLELYAHGGLGEVFLARDDELGREVALKRIRFKEAADSQRASRFQFEAEITGRLDHPGVVPVYGLGRDVSGRLYYAMRFIRGETLQDSINAFHRDYPLGTMRGAGGLAFQKLIRSFLTVCQTIAYAHSQNVIHRDIKPANIMLGSYGETLVVDWGLAKRIPEPVASDAETLELTPGEATATDHTMLGQIKGSPAYMSPEQAEGRTDLIGPRSDVYSLGATLYALLSGKSPFGDTRLFELLEHVKSGDFVPPRVVRSDMPPALEAICLKAMSRATGDRYTSALEMAADLEHWLADDPVSAWREPWTDRASRWMRKHRTLTSTVAAAVVVALLGISALAAQQRHDNDILGEKNNQLVAANQKERDAREAAEVAEKKAKDAAEQARLAKEAAIKSEKEAQRELYAFLILSADRALDSGDRAFAEQALEQCRDDLRNVEWRLLYRRTMGSSQTWRTPAVARSVAASRDGKFLAASSGSGPVRIWNRANASQVIELAGPAWQVAFLPDSDHLLVCVLRGFDVPLRDGRSFRFNSPSGDIELWSVSQRKKLDTWAIGVDRFVLSDDGQRLAAINVNWPGLEAKDHSVTSRITVYEVPSGKRLAMSDSIPGDMVDAAFSPDHRRLYTVARQQFGAGSLPGVMTLIMPGVASDQFQLQAWDMPAGKRTLLEVYSKQGPEKADAAGLVITPDGKQLWISDCQRQLVSNGPNACRMTQGRLLAFDAADGKPVATKGFDLEAADVAPVASKTRPFDVEASLEAHAGGLAISADGKRLAVINGYRILVFDREDGKRVAELAGHLSAPQSVVFDRDGENLFTAGGDDGRVKQWDIHCPRADRISLPSGQVAGGHGIAFSRDSRRFAISDDDGGIGIIDTETSQRQMTLPPISVAVPQDKLSAVSTLYPMHDPVNGVYGVGCHASNIRFSPDGKRLTATYDDRLICIWDLSGKKPAVTEFIDELALEPNQGYRLYTHLLLSPDGKHLASESYRGQDRYYRVWELAGRRLVFGHEKDDFLGLEPQMLFAADSSIFYLERKSPKAKPVVLAWNLGTGKPADTTGVDHLLASTDLVSPDGARQLRIVGGVLRVEDRATGQTLIEYADQQAYLWAIFSPDGNYILACNDKNTELFDARPLSSK